MANPDLPNFKLPIITAPADTFQRDVRNALQALASALGGGVSDGEDGATGPQGDPGTNGLDGDDGMDGADGATGPAGPAPSGTGFVHVTAGVLDTPAELTGDITAGATGVTAIGANKVTDAMLRDSAALSVIGRTGNTVGDPADIVAGSDGHVLKRSGATLVFAAEQDLANIGLGFFGTGTDGDLVCTAGGGAGGTVIHKGVTYTNTWVPGRDTIYNNLTINAGAYFDTNGYRVLVKGTLTLNGVIGRGGRDGVAGTAGGGGAGGALWSPGTIGGSGGGGAGGIAGLAAGNGSVTTSSPPDMTGGLGRGGSGGQNNLGTAGGTAGAITNVSDAQGALSNLLQALSGRQLGASMYTGGGGGGGGRGNSGTQGGGGGGGGGGCVVVSARQIVGSGFVAAGGGNGGDGYVSGVGCGGGGAGGGGWAVVVIGTGSFPTVDIIGGTGGVKGGAAPAANGANGANGLSYLFRIGA